jgi:Na+/melibiose symporter-like transporter
MSSSSTNDHDSPLAASQPQREQVDEGEMKSSSSEEANLGVEVPATNETSLFEKFSYSSFFMGQNFNFFFVSAFYQLFLLQRDVSPELISLIVLFPKIWDAINDPLVGILVDKIKLKSGKYLPWIRLAVILIPISTLFMYLMPISIPTWSKVLWAMAAFILWSTSITSNHKERQIIQTYARLFANIGIGGAMMAIPFLYPTIGWEWTSVIVSVATLLFTLLICFFCKERKQGESEEAPSFKAIFSQLLMNKYLLIYDISLFCLFVLNTSTSAGPIFAQYIWNAPQLGTLLSASSLLPPIFLAPLIPLLLKKFDKFWLHLCSLLLASILNVIIFFLDYYNKVLIIILFFIKGIIYAPVSVLIFQFTPDCVEYDMFKNDIRAEGASFSLQTFTADVCQAIGSALMMLVIGKVCF